MTTRKRPNIKMIGMCIALSLSLASYITLRVMESGGVRPFEPEVMAEELESNDALPDVKLFKQLMHKTLEFMLMAPRL